MLFDCTLGVFGQSYNLDALTLWESNNHSHNLISGTQKKLRLNKAIWFRFQRDFIQFCPIEVSTS